jgi:hypothetical protein
MIEFNILSCIGAIIIAVFADWAIFARVTNVFHMFYVTNKIENYWDSITFRLPILIISSIMTLRGLSIGNGFNFLIILGLFIFLSCSFFSPFRIFLRLRREELDRAAKTDSLEN